MPNTSSASKKRDNNEICKKNNSSCSKSNNSSSTDKNSSGSSTKSTNKQKARKRRHCELIGLSDLEWEKEFEGCNMNDAVAIENKMRSVAKVNSLTYDEMRLLLEKFVKNEHVLALITLSAEDELAREKRKTDQHAFIMTDTPGIPKLTRAKARELNKQPNIVLHKRADTKTEIAALIENDLQSDEDDEDYTFGEDDIVSDDDTNATVSDLDSNPHTPQTPLTVECNTPVKMTPDGCFKIPLDMHGTPTTDLRIATRTRSKFCLQQTNIEDIESEFVPPDVEPDLQLKDVDLNSLDTDWMQFLNDFTKPLNSNLITDDDDPVNDPEYVAAEKERIDAEELRDVNISKKELADLVAELCDGYIDEDDNLESIELQTPQRFIENMNEMDVDSAAEATTTTASATTATSPRTQVVRQLDFEEATPVMQTSIQPLLSQPEQYFAHVSDNTISSSTCNNQIYNVDCSFVTTSDSFVNPSTAVSQQNPEVDIAMETEQPTELQAYATPAHPNNAHLANITNELQFLDERYTKPYDTNYTYRYISMRRHMVQEAAERFKPLQYMKPDDYQVPALSNVPSGFLQSQLEILQQQFRLHVQLMMQTFIQAYSHPKFWKMAIKCKSLLLELQDKAEQNSNFNAWNLRDAIKLADKWETELNKDTPENKDLMSFMYREIGSTERCKRQIPRFHSRVMDIMLNSCVFMYPQYLPRIPFLNKISILKYFAPGEQQLIAMGLEKFLNQIIEYEKCHPFTTPLSKACKRIVNNTVFGKNSDRIRREVEFLKDVDYYNPIKYYYQHQRAPPVYQTVYGFADNTVHPPRNCRNLLPLVFRKYLEDQEQKLKLLELAEDYTTTATDSNVSLAAKRNLRKTTNTEENPIDSSSYLQFVRETLDGCNVTNGNNSSRKDAVSKLHRRYNPTNITINVNYVLTSGQGTSPFAPQQQLLYTQTDATSSEAPIATNVAETDARLTTPTLHDRNESQTPTVETASITESNTNLHEETLTQTVEGNRSNNTNLHEETLTQTVEGNCSNKLLHCKLRRRFNKSKSSLKLLKYRKRKRFELLQQRKNQALNLKNRFYSLLNSYQNVVQQQIQRFNHIELLQKYYEYFKALELYTDLLSDLKMYCQQHGKRARSQEDDAIVTSSARISKKANRQEENYKQMLMPETAEDANRKDAVYANNFYDKVEEVLKSSQQPDSWNKFNDILKNFDPCNDKVATLYHEIEELFLPDHVELAEIFLTFLLPSQAAEIGKFFEHFMINNMSTFVNKLNIYFKQQPAQIRKIYACLNELAEEPSVSMKQLENRILPLLKGNQFLIDWFLQQFAEQAPPKRLLPSAEHISFKELQNSQNSDVETVNELLDSPNSNEQDACQLRYINGRIFYGSKITLPAKLSFMAASYQPDSDLTSNSPADANTFDCVHAVRGHGEQLLSAAAVAAQSNDCNSDGEDEEIVNTPAIDFNCAEDERSSCSFELCDENGLRAHALRLNPAHYNSCFTASTSTPLSASQHATHNPNAKKSSLSFSDDSCKVSPRKQLLALRKSPIKKVKSPQSQMQSIRLPRPLLQPPMVVIHEQSNAIACAKKLQSMISEENSSEGEEYSKRNINIVACAKTAKPVMQQSVDESYDLEFLPVHVPQPEIEVNLSIIKQDIDSSEEFLSDNGKTINSNVNAEIAQSSEDCKMEIVATMATDVEASPTVSSEVVAPWTRDEDKIFLIEMRLDSQNKQQLFERIHTKLPLRSLPDIETRHQFLIDFLSKLQGK